MLVEILKECLEEQDVIFDGSVFDEFRSEIIKIENLRLLLELKWEQGIFDEFHQQLSQEELLQSAFIKSSSNSHQNSPLTFHIYYIKLNFWKGNEKPIQQQFWIYFDSKQLKFAEFHPLNKIKFYFAINCAAYIQNVRENSRYIKFNLAMTTQLNTIFGLVNNLDNST